MTTLASHRLLAIVTLGLSSALALAPHCAAAELAPAVLDLDEAAALLRVKPEAVRELAQAQRIPARRVGDSWRFSRAALLQWLGAAQVGVAPTAPLGRLDPLEPAQVPSGALPALGERGATPEVSSRTARAAPESRAEASPPPPTVGERPTAATAEEVALRDQRALLKRGAVTVDLGVSYSYSEQSFFPFVRQERRSLAVNTALRYGLIDDMQVTLRLPAASSRIKTFTLGTTGGASTQSAASEASTGDVTLSLRGVALREAVGRPNVIWSIDTVLPSGPGDRGLGAGLVVSKSYDPAVIFAGLNYLRGLALDPADPRRLLPRHNLGLSMGYTYAVNDALALSSVFASSFRSATSTAGGSFPAPRERHQIQFGMTWLLARGLFVEPAVAMRLGGEHPDLAVSLNLAYTF